MGLDIGNFGFKGLYNDVKAMDRFSGDQVNSEVKDNKICTFIGLGERHEIPNPEFILLDSYLRTKLNITDTHAKLYSPVEMAVVHALDDADGNSDHSIDFNVLDSMDIKEVSDKVIKGIVVARDKYIEAMDKDMKDIDNYNAYTPAVDTRLIKITSTEKYIASLNNNAREKARINITNQKDRRTAQFNSVIESLSK